MYELRNRDFTFLVCFTFCLVLIDVLILTYVLIVKLPIALAVTYEYRTTDELAASVDKTYPPYAEAIKGATQV